MDKKSSDVAVLSLVVIALITGTIVPTVRGDDGVAVAVPDQASRDRATSGPIVLAQGRCFNGRCY
jgi:hypothetical protein